MPIIAETAATSGPTLGELVTEVATSAQGFAVAPDRILSLVGDLSDTALSFKVDSDCSPGVFEIGDELILVTAVDASTHVCTIHPRGRGWQGSTASVHSDGDFISESPAFPRRRIVQAINDAISGLYPQLFGVGSVTGVVASGTVELPADAELVLDVRTLVGGSWERVRDWEAEFSSSAAPNTGKAVRVVTLSDGTEVQVVFGTLPAPLSSPEQYWSETGLSIGAKDIVVTAVLAKFVTLIDIGRLTDRFVTPRGDTQQPQIGAGVAIARQLKADYKVALDAEVAALRELHPARVHFVR